MNVQAAATSQVPTETHAKSNLVNIAEGLQSGVPPTNAQIHTELDATKQFLAPQIPAATSSKEEQVLKDAVKLVEAAQTTIDTKNADEKVQQLVKAVESVKTSDLSATPIEIKEQIIQFNDGLKTMTMSVINSAEYRKALSELFNLLKEMFYIGSDQIQDKLPNKNVGDITLNEAANTASNVADKMKNLSTDDIPEEQKRAFKQHLKEFLNSLNAEGIRQGMEGFMSIWEALGDNMLSKIDRLRVNSDVNRVGATAKAVVEEFTGQKTLDDFLIHLKAVMDSISSDEELENYLRDVREYLLAAIEKPELVDSDYFNDRGNELLSRGSKIMDKYRNNDHFVGIFESARQLGEEIKNDDSLNLIKNRSTQFFSNFVYTDAANNAHLDLELMDKMRANLLPFLASRIHEIPIRRVEIKDKDYEYMIFDDLRLAMDEKLLPEQIKLHFENSTDLSIRSADASTSTTRVSFSVANLKPKFENFYFSLKKTSTPSLEDEGRMSARVKGDGLSIRGRFILTRDPKTGAVLSDSKIAVRISRLQLDIIKTKHEILLPMATMLYGNYIKQRVEKIIEESLTQTISGYGDVLNTQVFSKLPTAEGLAQQGIEAVKSGIPV